MIYAWTIGSLCDPTRPRDEATYRWAVNASDDVWELWEDGWAAAFNRRAKELWIAERMKWRAWVMDRDWM